MCPLRSVGALRLIPGFRGARNRFQWVSRFGWVLIPAFRGARNRFQWVSRFGWVLIPGNGFRGLDRFSLQVWQVLGSVSRGLESCRGSEHFEGSGFYWVLIGFDDFNGMEYGVFKVPGHFQMKGSCFQTSLHFSCCFFFRSWKFIPQQQNATWSLHNTDFGVFWASWGGFREKNGFREPVLGTAGSANQFWEPDPGFDGFRGSTAPEKVAWKRFRRFRCMMGSEGLGSAPEVLTEPLLGTGFQELEVLRRFRAKVSDSYSILRKYTLVLWKCTFVLWKYAFVRWKYAFVLWKYALQVYFSTLKVCFCALKSMLLYLESMLLYVESISL